MRYGTCNQWAKYFERENDVKISDQIIYLRLKAADKLGIMTNSRGKGVLYPELYVRKVCSDLIQKLPIADKNGFFEKDGIRYGTVSSFARVFNISVDVIRSRIIKAQPPIDLIKGRYPRGQIWDFYPESRIREICADFLEDIPQIGKAGYLEEDSVRYCTIKALSKILNISANTVSSRISKAKSPITSKGGKMQHGQIYDLYSESEVREICSDLLEDLPQSDENGFFEKDGVRYGNFEAWAKVLPVSSRLITKRLDQEKIKGIKAKTIQGIIHNFYPEHEVRRVCADFIEDIPQADKNGFFEKGGIRYGTVLAFAKELHIHQPTVNYRVTRYPMTALKGKIKGKVYKFYPEPDVRKACADFFEDLPQADENGFFEKGGVKYGTVFALVKELSVSQPTIKDRVTKHSITLKRGRNLRGRVSDFYPEPEVRRVCADLIQDLPQVDENGFFEKGGVKYGTVSAFAKEFSVSMRAIKIRINRHSIPSRAGKAKHAEIFDFYPEREVLRACADIFEDLPLADEHGFFEKEEVKYGTINALAKKLFISNSAIRSRIAEYSMTSARGKLKGGQIHRFYPEPAVREACADLLATKKSKK